MATKPLSVFATPGRMRRRPRHIAPDVVARFILVALALVGVIAIALLVLGLLNVPAVTSHFRIH
jgi:putative copper export protein